MRLDDVIGEAGRSLGGLLVEAKHAEARFDLLDAFLVRRLAIALPADPIIERSFTHLRGRGRVAALADTLDWSRKHLARWFRDATGLRPNQFARLARFERLTGALQAEPCASLAELAFASGCADQPHMTHEVRRLSGATPAALRARLIPQGGGVRD